MDNVVPLYRKMHVLFLENDWVIRQILIEHFATDDHCHAVSFSGAEKALDYIRIRCGGERIFSNVHLGGRGGIDLSTGSEWQGRIELAVAPGYDAEKDRFRAIEAELGFFRVKPFDYIDLWQRVRDSVCHSSYK